MSIKMKTEIKGHNPIVRKEIVNFRANEDDLAQLELLKRVYPGYSNGKILRALIRAAAEDAAKELMRKKK